MHTAVTLGVNLHTKCKNCTYCCGKLSKKQYFYAFIEIFIVLYSFTPTMLLAVLTNIRYAESIATFLVVTVTPIRAGTNILTCIYMGYGKKG